MDSSDSSGGCCLCAKEVPKYINCDERNQKSSLSQGSCTFFDSEENAIVGSQCPFVFSTSATENGLFLLPPTVSELNSVVCGNLSREVKGPLCGRCTNNTGPSVYSVGSTLQSSQYPLLHPPTILVFHGDVSNCHKWKNHFFKMKRGYRDGLKHQRGRNKGSLHSLIIMTQRL